MRVPGPLGRILLLGLAATAVLGIVLTGQVTAGEHRVALCHVPPGNPTAKRVIHVAPRSVPAHLAHGDFLGETCATPTPTNTPIPDTPTNTPIPDTPTSTPTG